MTKKLNTGNFTKMCSGVFTGTGENPQISFGISRPLAA